jgi:hypothetical protein
MSSFLPFVICALQGDIIYSNKCFLSSKEYLVAQLLRSMSHTINAAESFL